MKKLLPKILLLITLIAPVFCMANPPVKEGEFYQITVYHFANTAQQELIEQYLKDTIASNRKGIEANMFNAKLISSYTYLIDSARRKKDRAIWDKKQALKNGLLKERSTFKTLLETSKKTGLH